MHLFDKSGDRILTLEEAAWLLILSSEDVMGRAQRGSIPWFSVGEELMFKKSELELWILSLIYKADNSNLRWKGNKLSKGDLEWCAGPDDEIVF